MMMLNFVIMSENHFFKNGLIHLISDIALRETFIPVFILDNSLSTFSHNCILVHDYPFSLLQIMEGIPWVNSRDVKEISMRNTLADKKRRERNIFHNNSSKISKIHRILCNEIGIPGHRDKDKKRMLYAFSHSEIHLTKRQLDFLNCLTEGLSIKQSALKMGVCAKTIHTYKNLVKTNMGFTRDSDIAHWLSTMNMMTGRKLL